MEEMRFDAWTRALAGDTTRRHALRGLTVLTVSGFASRHSAGAKRKGGKGGGKGNGRGGGKGNGKGGGKGNGKGGGKGGNGSGGPKRDDYSFLGEMGLPWTCGETLHLTQDWRNRDEGANCHWAIGFALDFAGAKGTQVRSPVNGYIKDINPYEDSAPTFGEHITLTPKDLETGRLLDDWEVIIAHLDEISGSLETGDSVRPGGSVLGWLGDSGLYGTKGCEDGCPHIHLEFRYKNGFPGRLRTEDLPFFAGRRRDDFSCDTPCGDARCFAGAFTNPPCD